MKKLYEISADMNKVFEMAEEAAEQQDAGEEVDMDVFYDTLEGLQMDFEQKAEGSVKIIRNIESGIMERDAQIEAFKREIENLEALNSIDYNKIKYMKQYLSNMMEATGQKKVNAGLFRVTLAQNGGKMPILKNYKNAEELPAEFRNEQTVYTANDEAIRKYLDNGGTSDFFKYGERGSHLLIKG